MKHSISHFMRQAILVSALATAPIIAAAQGNAVVMLAKDGTSYELALDKVSRIDFNSTDVTITGKSGELKTMMYADVNRILIGSDGAGLSELLAKDEIAIWPSVTTGPLTITGADPGTVVLVYDQRGILVKNATASDEPLTLDISSASPGIVIVNIGNRSVKVIKK